MNLSMKNIGAALLMGGIPMLMCSCGGNEAPQLTQSGLDPQQFVATVGGKQTALYTLRNERGMEVCITNLGGRIVSLMVPDRDGQMQDVVLGLTNVAQYADYENTPSDYGAAIGRYANRIGQGRFTLDGTEYTLPQNNFGHCLHGGPTGWQYQVYDVVEADSTSVTLQIVSPDGDNGFPGTVTATVTYVLGDDNTLSTLYSATTDAPTIINMTNHAYFNLNGDPTTDCMDNVLFVNARRMTPVDSTFMTTGEVRDIAEGTPFDFYSEPKPMGRDIEADDEQLHFGLGYDHNWVLEPACADAEAPSCVLYSPKTGILMVQKTTEPGVQVYTANFQDGTMVGKKGIAYPKRCAVCLETQKFPDTPNKPEWPSCTLRPGEQYQSMTILEFFTDKDFPAPQKD